MNSAKDTFFHCMLFYHCLSHYSISWQRNTTSRACKTLNFPFTSPSLHHNWRKSSSDGNRASETEGIWNRKGAITWNGERGENRENGSIWELGRLINFPIAQHICWRPCKHFPPLRSMALKGISCLFSYRLSLCGFISYPESRRRKTRDNGTEGRKEIKIRLKRSKC